MESNSGITSNEKQFLEFMIDFIVEKNPGDLTTNLHKVTTHLQDNFGATHELNLYRKQFGNLKDCV